jgi:predicted nucleic acid-binding protein
MIVVDTMILAHMVIASPWSEECHSLRLRESHWVAPEFVEVELQNVLWQYLRRGDLTVPEAAQRYDAGLSLLRCTMSVDAGRVLSVAYTLGCSAYDSRFAVLAEELACPLVTYDKQLLAKVPGSLMPERAGR